VAPANIYPGAQIPGEPPSLAGDRGFDFVTFPIANKRMLAFGDDTDEPIVRAAAGFIRKKRSTPFLLAVSIHNPHDICYWIMNKLPADHPSSRRIDMPERDLPPLPGNFHPP